MLTFEALARFFRDYARLTTAQREAYAVARRQFVEDLRSGRGFRPGLRVKRVQSTSDVWEMTWRRTAARPGSTATSTSLGSST